MAMRRAGVEAATSGARPCQWPAERQHKGLTVWFTGLSGSGKTTISQCVFLELSARAMRVELLDAEDLRKQFNTDLGFSKPDRDENVRRLGFAAHLLTRNGIVALVSAISPYRSTREEIRRAIGSFLEVHVNAPVGVCEQRDPKGLYKRARAGQIHNVTGIDEPYEPPLSPEVRCDTDQESLRESTVKVVTAVVNFFATETANAPH
jgi:adenylylsulfate kinase